MSKEKSIIIPTESADFVLDEARMSINEIFDLPLEIMKIKKKYLKEDANLYAFKKEIKTLLLKALKNYFIEYDIASKNVKRLTKANIMFLLNEEKNKNANKNKTKKSK